MDKFQPPLPAREETIAAVEDGSPTLFQPPLPAREETTLVMQRLLDKLISTPSSRTGRDVNSFSISANFPNFNPLFPHGKRRLRLP